MSPGNEKWKGDNMDIIATDLFYLLAVGVLAAVLSALVALAQRARQAKPHPLDCYGIFTEDEATALFALKERYNEMEELQR